MEADPGTGGRQPVDPALRIPFEIFSAILRKNSAALALLSDLEADLNHLDSTDERLLVVIGRLVDECRLMSEELSLLTHHRNRALYDVISRIDLEIRRWFDEQTSHASPPLSIRLSEASGSQRSLVGGKAAGLVELERRLPGLVPEGFVITSAAYGTFLQDSDLHGKIRMLLDDIGSISNPHLFRTRTSAIRECIRKARVPEQVCTEIRELASSFDVGSAGWAVRSSAGNEDGARSFAGQYDTLLSVATEDLQDAYREVLASRFSDRAVRYRIYCGFREVETPMAVLFMPMLEPAAAGVACTRNPQRPGQEEMLVSAVPGLADRLVRGEVQGDDFILRRSITPKVLSAPQDGCLDEKQIEIIGNAAVAASEKLGRDLEIEWAIDGEDHLWLLQARDLVLDDSAAGPSRRKREPHIVEGGVTVAPGRAVGPVEFVDSSACLTLSHTAPVVVTDQARIEMSPLVQDMAALVVRGGSPVGHLATLLREYSVPSIFQVGAGIVLLHPHETVSVNASMRRIHRGSRWTGMRSRVLERVEARKRAGAPHGRLHDLVLALNLTDPAGSHFRAKRCRSLHDVVRYVHEKAIQAMFRLGDRNSRFWRPTSRKLLSSVPVKIRIISLDGSVRGSRWSCREDDVDSIPFRALFRGMTDPRVSWSTRHFEHLDLMPRDFVEQVLGGTRGPRRKGDSNYAIVGRNYVNLNARLVFHYLMVDALVGPSRETNHVHFRARGGGGSDDNRERRARFMELVLRSMGIVVNRRGDLVTGWLRGETREESEEALVRIGLLMACARQLDMIMTSDSWVPVFVERFIEGDYASFS
jgi:pyruvate,water dikinase